MHKKLAGKMKSKTRTEKCRHLNCDRCWKSLMRLGASTGCHQRPERSFFLFDYQFPVCARCTGVFIGNIMGIILFAVKAVCAPAAIAGCICMAADWLLQRFHIAESTNPRRLLTGIAGGYGIITLELLVIAKIYHAILMMPGANSPLS